MAGGKIVGSSELDAATARAIRAALEKALDTTAAVTPALGGDLSGTTASATVVANAVTNSKLADMVTARIKGRTTAGTGDPEDLTATQVTAMLNVFTSALKGLVPLSGGGTTNFLRADGTWAATPLPGAGTVTNAMFSTAAGQPGGAWNVWNATTFTNVTGGTFLGAWRQEGKTMYLRGWITGGTATAAGLVSVLIPNGRTAANTIQHLHCVNGFTVRSASIAAGATTIVISNSATATNTNWAAAANLNAIRFNGVIEIA